MSMYTNDSQFGRYLNTTSPDQQDAWAQLEALLRDRGLGDLISQAQDWLISGYDANQVEQRLRETPTWQNRFSAIVERQKAGLPPISEADVISTERAYAQIFAAVGLPQGYYDQPSDFAELIAKDVSPAEVQQRAVAGFQAAQNADPATRAELQRLYGLSEGDLAAYFLDPDKTVDLLTRRYTAAQIAGSAQRTGYGELSQQQAESITALDITPTQAQQGFEQLAQSQELFSGLPGQGENSITTDQQLSAVFGGNTQQQQQIERRAKSRVATFQQGGQYAGTETGTSVGSAK